MTSRTLNRFVHEGKTPVNKRKNADIRDCTSDKRVRRPLKSGDDHNMGQNASHSENICDEMAGILTVLLIVAAIHAMLMV